MAIIVGDWNGRKALALNKVRATRTIQANVTPIEEDCLFSKVNKHTAR
jgi:hypothetical protein